MFHAEGKAGFDLGYIEGLADGEAGVKGGRAYASGRAHIGVGENVPYWATDPFDTRNYYALENEWLPRYYAGYGRLLDKEARLPSVQKGQLQDKGFGPPPSYEQAMKYSNHSSARRVGGASNMYGFRRRRFGRRRLFVRRPTYRRRRFY